MKIHALHVGDTKVPYGQFYGGTQGWVGLRGFYWFQTDKSHYIVVPIYAYLVEHPNEGLILIDTGVNWEQANDHDRYYRSRLTRMATDSDEYTLSHGQELAVQVTALGYRVEDIRRVIVTHLHEDHIGVLPSLPQAKIYVSQGEWARTLAWNRRTRLLPFLSAGRLSPSMAMLADPVVISYRSGPMPGFETSEDLFGDGSIIAVPTPGHTAGHQSVLVGMDGYHVLCAGDVLYTLRHLAIDQVRPVALGRKPWAAQAQSIRDVHRLLAAMPETVVAPAHDHTRYLHGLLEPMLASGTLSAEARTTLRSYVDALFTSRWMLGPDAVPRYVPDEETSRTGTVTEPDIELNGDRSQNTISGR